MHRCISILVAWIASMLLAVAATSAATTTRSAVAPTTAGAMTPPPPPMKPGLKWTTLAQYEAEIGEAGVLFQNDYLLLFAPTAKTKEAKIIFGCLTRAYDELAAIVGQPTKYKIVVYHLPKGWGGTSECVIEYDYSNLDLASSEEWRKHKVPHVSGYIEEMAHNFVSSTKAQFGWEMVGWSLGVKVTKKVAGNPIFDRAVQETRKTQAETYARYRALGFTFPADIEPNLCDRIHAHLLWQCEQRYGPAFWKDAFTEIRARRKDLDAAEHLGGNGDASRNERYRITVDSFDRLPRVGFKKLLETNQISTTVDAKSLHPTESGWDRKFVPKK
jgi:hypothetical protein